jgi:glycosyltransferase involved in cell wall biosynthesis
VNAKGRIGLVGLIAGGQSGIPRYAVMLTRALDRVSYEFPALLLTLITNRRGCSEIDPRNLEVRIPNRPFGRFNAGPERILAEQILAARAKADILHFFDLSGPILAPSRAFVTTAHDASVAYRPRRRHRYKRHLSPWALAHARRIVAVSSFAKDEVVDHFGADPSKIDVVYSGPGIEPLGATAAQTRHAANGPYLLYVGNLGANKNATFLIEAFERTDVSAELLFVGGKDKLLGPLLRAIEISPARERIRVISDASDIELDALYRNAIALVLPSRYEGFGFPPLEAMSRGCPVLASDIPALREISGTGAMLLPLDNHAAWSDGIRRIVEDERLRSELRERGTATVARYSWDEAARQICRIFLTLLPTDETG